MPLLTLLLALTAWAVAPQAAAPPTIFDLVKSGTPEQVRAIVAKDPSLVNAKDAAGNTPLHHAAIVGSVPIAEYLLSKKADVDAENVEKLKPLFEAIRNGKDAVAKTLIDRGARIGGALQWAARSNRTAIMELLIAKGADIEERDNSGFTPLTFVARTDGPFEALALLVEKGANINLRDSANRTPLDNVAVYAQDSRAIDLLLARLAEVNTAPASLMGSMAAVVRRGHLRLFDYYMSKGGEALFADETNRRTFMRSAILGRSMEIVKKLQSRNIPLDVSADIAGLTPLHTLARNPKALDMIDLLVRNGADVNARTRDGRSAYNIADAAANRDACALLVKLGASTEPQKFPVLTGPYLGQTPPGDEPRPFAPGIVAPGHGTITVSTDGRELYWPTGTSIMMMRVQDGRWTQPAYAPFSGPHDIFLYDDVPFVTPDNKRLFFTSKRPVGSETSQKENIWFVERTASGWSEAKPAGAAVNALGLHWQVSVSSAGTLYFAGNDIYCSRLVGGEYAAPVKLGPAVNTSDGETQPFIAPDESYLLFIRVFGQVPVPYVTFKGRDGEWLPAVKLDLPGAGGGLMVSPDGKYLFADGRWKSAKFLEDMRTQAAAPPTIFDLVKSGTPEQVRALVAKDASLVNAKDAAGNTPLHHAAIVGSVPMAETLLSLGATIDATNAAAGTPLCEAITVRKTDVALLLIARGADVRKTGVMGRGPLHWAASNDQDALVAPLVAKGADLELRDGQGVTALMEAVMRAHTTAVVRALLESGADVNATNGRLTILDHAIRGYYAVAPILELLFDRGVSYTPEQAGRMLRAAAAGGAVTLFRKLVDKHGDSLFADAQANTRTMSSAVLGGSAEIVQALLAKGIAIDKTPDANGLTLLHKIAEIPRAAGLIELLVKNGLDLNARTTDGHTAFNLAVGSRNEEARRRLVTLAASQAPQQFPNLTGPYLGQTPPTGEPVPFARGIVIRNHGGVTVSPDGTEMYWSSPPSPGAPDSSMRVMMTRLRDGRWTAPEPAPFTGTADNSPWFDDSPFVSPDNKKLFFLSTRPIGASNAGKENIWFVERTATGWSSARPLGPEVNAVSGHWEFSVSNAGTLYFPSVASGDIMFSKFENGKYSTPVNIGPAINTREMGACPFIAPDESYLVFWRVSGPAPGSYISYRLRDGAWSQPIALKQLPGGPTFVTPDGKYIFFVGGWAPASFIEELRPKQR